MDPTGTRLLKPVPRRVAPCRLSTLSVSSGASSSTRRAPTPSQLWCPGSTKRQFLRRSRVGARPGYQSRAGPTGGIAEGRQRLHLTARPGQDDSRVRTRGDCLGDQAPRHRQLVLQGVPQRRPLFLSWRSRSGRGTKRRQGKHRRTGADSPRRCADFLGRALDSPPEHGPSPGLCALKTSVVRFDRGNWVRRRVLVLLIPVEFLACVGGLLYLLARLEPPREMPRTIRRRPGRVNAPPPPRLRPDERPSRRDRP